MSRLPCNIILFAALGLAAGCRDWMDDEEQGAAFPAPTGECLCARACGVPIANNSQWIDPQGKAHALGYCPPQRDESIYEARAACQCQVPQQWSTVPGISPNH